MSYDEKVTLKLSENGKERVCKVVVFDKEALEPVKILVWPEPIYALNKNPPVAYPVYTPEQETLVALVDQAAHGKDLHNALLFVHGQFKEWSIYTIESNGSERNGQTKIKYLSKLPRPVFEKVDESRLPKPFAFLKRHTEYLLYGLLILVGVFLFSSMKSVLAQRNLLSEVDATFAAWFAPLLSATFIVFILIIIALPLWEWLLERQARKTAQRRF